MKQNYVQLTKKICVSALLLALGMLLPFLTGQIPSIGNMLLPMHIPVLLCGIICGWQYGAAVGFTLPLFRSLIFGAPPIYPNAASMAFELLAYGAVIGIVYKLLPKKGLLSVYISLISAMLGGRIVWAVARLVMLGVAGTNFTFALFISGAFTTAVPGMILQIILIPAIMTLLYKTKVIRFDEKNNTLL